MHLSQAEIASVVCREKDSVKKRLKRIRTEKLGFREGFDAGGDPLAAVKYTPGCRPRRMETAGGQSVEKRPVHCDIPLQTSGNSRGRLTLHTKQALQSGSRSRPGETCGKIY